MKATKKQENRGGKRPGSGQPKKEPTTAIRVPTVLVEEIKELIAQKKPGN